MKSLVGITLAGGGIVWQDIGENPRDKDKGITISIRFPGSLTIREATKSIQEVINQNQIDWLRFSKPNWIFSSGHFKFSFPQYSQEDWLHGEFVVDFERGTRPGPVPMGGISRDSTFCQFYITKDLIMDQLPKQIFLSHKSVNKDLVREFQKALKAVALDTWLDEDEMPAGTSLHRGILDGFKNSCAAVFFITPEFIDEKVIANEINYAIGEKTKKGERFSIITLVFENMDGKKGIVPELLKQYVWKEPKNHLEALREIIRALPLKLDSNWQWKEFAVPVTPEIVSSTSRNEEDISDECINILKKFGERPQDWETSTSELALLVSFSEQRTQHILDILKNREFLDMHLILPGPVKYYLAEKGRAWLFNKGLL